MALEGPFHQIIVADPPCFRFRRKQKLGYNRAGRIEDQLEAAGILGPFEGSKARQVLVVDDLALEQKLKGES